MECSRHSEGHEHTSQPLPLVHQLDQPLTTEPSVPEVSVEELAAREHSESPPLPGYLTLEIDLNALGDVAPWRSSHNAASDEPRGKG